MLVLKVEGEEFALDYLGDWNSVSLKRGMVLDVLLASGDPSYPPDLWAGFLVMEVFVNMASDGTQEVRAKSLGCADAEVTKRLSAIFNRKAGLLHLCGTRPCAREESYGLHVTRFKRFTVEGFKRDYITGYMGRQITKWLEGDGAGAEEEEDCEAEAGDEVPEFGKDLNVGQQDQALLRAAAKTTTKKPKRGAAEEEGPNPGRGQHPPRKERRDKAKEAAAREGLRQRLEQVRSRLAGDAPGPAANCATCWALVPCMCLETTMFVQSLRRQGIPPLWGPI